MSHRTFKVLVSGAAVLTLVGTLSCQGRDKREGRPPAVVLTPSSPPSPLGPPPPKPFSEETRKAVFQEVLRSESRANQEATVANPDADSVGTSTNPEKMVRRVQKRSRVSEALQQRYRAEIAARYGLSEGELAEIVNEGRTKGWPAPSPQ